MTELLVTDITLIPPYSYDSFTEIYSSDLPIEVTTWSNGFKSVEEIEPDPEPEPEEVIPEQEKVLDYPTLLVLAREDKEVSAAQALNLLEKYRRVCGEAIAASALPAGSPPWNQALGRAMFRALTLSQEEVQ